VSDREDFELEALQRQLDDAFETTRPRRGFEDELWLRIQTRRPLWTRIVDGAGGLFQAIREVPAVPASAIAVLLVVALGIGILRLSGPHAGGGGAASLAQGGNSYGPAVAPYRSQTAFGPLPAPSAGRSVGQQTSQAPADTYAGAVTLTWTGQLNLAITSAPVFRYFEPSEATADQFATSLGAAPVSRPGGYLGSYSGTTLQVLVRGTVQSPPSEPFFFITPTSQAPVAAGATPTDVAGSYLGSLSLAPAWAYMITTASVGDVTRVSYLRQFDVPSYGPAYVVDGTGERYGYEVDVQGGRPIEVSGPLPLGFDSANYPIITAGQAVQMALSGEIGQSEGAFEPRVDLSNAELVYVLVVAGDHSFYEPAILFSGSFSVNGHVYTKRILVPAIDPSQLMG
jgi:hypothetical protein